MKQEFQPSKSVKRYYLIAGFFWAVFVVLLIHVGIQIWQDSSSDFYEKFIFVPILALITPYLAVSNLYKWFRMKIVLNDVGITFVTFESKIVAQWSELIKIEKLGTGYPDREIILIPKRMGKKNLAELLFQPPNHIPIYLFEKHWRNSELGQQIKQYAPHLFQ